ncbi:homeobox protein goosecoid-like [Cetorhinus maximus]
MFASDFSIDSILSNKDTKCPSEQLLWHCCPFLLHSADDLLPSKHTFGYSRLYSAPGSVPISGILGHEDFYYGHAERQSYCSDCTHQPSHHYCPGHTGASRPTAMSQLGLHFLAQAQKRRRRHRTVFTEQQLRDLETLFNKTSYPDSGSREKLARTTHLSEETIKVWFKNRRAKMRKQKKPLLGQLDSSSEFSGTDAMDKCPKQCTATPMHDS